MMSLNVDKADAQAFPKDITSVAKAPLTAAGATKLPVTRRGDGGRSGQLVLPAAIRIIHSVIGE